MKDSLYDYLKLIGLDSCSAQLNENINRDQPPAPHDGNNPPDPPELFPPRPPPPPQDSGSVPEVATIKIKSHNINKHKPEAYVHADLHEGWDIVFYQELSAAPLLPFGWNSDQSSPKVLSSLLLSGAEGACIVISARLAPFVTALPSPSPGAICASVLHLPGQPPILLVSLYAQPPRRPELEKSLNALFQKYPLWIVGGDFNAQVSSLDTNGKTANKWKWLSSLVEEKKDAVDSFRMKNNDTLAYTRYRNPLLPCDTRIDLLLLSQPLIATPALHVLEAHIIQHDVSSDHHPISASIELPFTPAHPLPQPHTLFRRLNQLEELEFLKSIQQLEQWAYEVTRVQVSPHRLVQFINSVVPQLARAFHQITRPCNPHRETPIEREFKERLSQLPKGHAQRTRALRRLQERSESWRARQSKREKKKLHYAMVKGSKIKKSIDKSLRPDQKQHIQLRDDSTNPPRMESDPQKLGDMFSACLSRLGGDPEFQVNERRLQEFITNLPKCPEPTRTEPLPLPDIKWLQETTQAAKPTKATGDDEINYYLVSLLPPALQQLLLQAIHFILTHGPPPEWSSARVCLLYKKGDRHDPVNYRPICLIQTLVKLSSAWQCSQLKGLTQKHKLVHPCQHGGLNNHRCGDHIYDVVSRMLLSKGRLYHLYIDFNKAFNSIPLQGLWTTLRGYGLPESLILSIQRMYNHAVEQPLVNGIPTSGHTQKRGVRQGCPLSPLLFILYLNLMFFYLDTVMDWGLECSIHAFIDDILFRARSVQDIKKVYEAFDGPARELGLDMNITKTELHAVKGTGHTEIHSRHGGVLSTRKADGSPHQVYKYLGVYFYTSEHAYQVLQCVKSMINSFYAHLAPLQLTASELIMLTNKQLIPTVAYRLLAGPVPATQLHSLQQTVWYNLCKYGRLPRSMSPKDRHTTMKLVPLETFVQSQIHNYSMRYLNEDGPTQSNHFVRKALLSPTTNWLQEAFVDATNALGGRCHGFGPWNPCKTDSLMPGEEVHVQFNSGWHTGTVLDYDEHAQASKIRFHSDGTEFHVKDKLHNFSLHPPPQLLPDPPPQSTHVELAPPLLSLPPPLPPYPPPYGSQFVESNQFGHLFKYTGPAPKLQVSSLTEWGCESVLEAWQSPDSRDMLWVYLDG